MKHLTYCIITLFCLGFASCAPRGMNVLFVAGPNDHCGENPCHHYIEDLSLLKKCLDQQTTDQRVRTELLIGERPSQKQLKRANVLVMHSSADRKAGEWHVLFPTYTGTDTYDKTTLEFLNLIDRQVQRGMGIVSLHYTNWVDHPVGRTYMESWLGGYYLRSQSKVKADLTRKETTGQTQVQLMNAAHPVLRGVRAWNTESEFYYDMYFKPEDPRRTPLLSAGLPLNQPAQHTVSWALERPEGGKAVVFTDGHFHKNMYLEDYRKYLLNAILWTGGGQVPAQGVVSNVD